MSKPKIAILTSFVDFNLGYSLIGIVLDQARMLRDNGYDYDILCLKNFNESDKAKAEGLNVKYVLPQTKLHPYKPNEPPREDWDEQVKAHLEGKESCEGYLSALREYDVIIAHDLMFLDWHLVQNAALRECIRLWPMKTWIHWVHSAPSAPPHDLCFPSSLRFSAAPNSVYVYLNESQAFEYSLMINAPRRAVRVCYNPKDIRDVWNFDPLTNELIRSADLLDSEILQVYPFSTPRWESKGVDRLLAIFGRWASSGVDAKLVLVNAHANSKKDAAFVKAIKNKARSFGLMEGTHYLLTSEWGRMKKRGDLAYSVPHRVVQDLLLASNMFIFPSFSECCSLIQAEAAIAGGCFMVLNRDFQPMLEFASPSALHYEFTKNDPSKNPAYYECVAREILANFRCDPTIETTTKARRRLYNKEWIWENQFEPLLYLNAADRLSVDESQEPETEDEKIVKLRDPTNGVDEKSGEVDIDNPYDGMPCEVYGICRGDLREKCFKMAGKCLMKEEEV